MKTKLISLVLALFMSIALFSPAAFANTYTADDINSMLDSISGYIEQNMDVIKANITAEADSDCGYAINLALNTANQGAENYDASYELLYSVYAYIMLVVNNDITTKEATEVFERVANDFLIDEYFDEINPNADKKSLINLKNEKINAEAYDSLCKVVYDYISYGIVKAEALLQELQQEVNEKAPMFEDVSDEDWFYGAVSYAYASGLFRGTSDTHFSPQLTMTRGMFVTVLQRFNAPSEITAEHGFSDVSADAYYSSAVSWAKQAGLIVWAEGDKFSPDQPVTREEILSSMYMIVKNAGIASVSDSIDLDVTDKDQISSWAVEGINWAYNIGVIKGYGDGSVKPNGTATRAEVAQIFLNFFAVLAVTNSK